MEHVFLGVHFPAPRNYERIRVDNVNFNENCSELIEKFRELTSNSDEVSLAYLGQILEETEPINRYNLRNGSTVHVLRKSVEEQPKNYKSFSELDVSRVCAMYRSLNSGNFHISRPEVAKQIFETNPEIKKDVVAMSILKDPILLMNLQNPDTVRKLAQHHRVLIEASETIVKALKSAKSLVDATPAPLQPIVDDFSDSSSSSGSENNSPQASGSNMARRITQEYLRQSIAAAQGRNSLANISQRNLNQGSSNPISPSTSSGSVPTGPRFISNSMFMNAMNEVLMANRRTTTAPEESVEASNEATVEAPPAAEALEAPAEVSEERMEEDQAAQDEREIEMIRSFQTQLQQMEDMGLRNKAQNIQALMVCNGNLEAAVNLVFAEMNSEMF